MNKSSLILALFLLTKSASLGQPSLMELEKAEKRFKDGYGVPLSESDLVEIFRTHHDKGVRLYRFRRSELRRLDLTRVVSGNNLEFGSPSGFRNQGDINRVHLREVDFTEAHLEGAILEKIEFEHCAFEQTHLEKANLSRARVHEDNNLVGVHLEDADLEEIQVDDRALIVRASLDRTTWSFAKLGRCEFLAGSLNDAKFGRWVDSRLGYTHEPASLIGTEFIGPKAKPTEGNNSRLPMERVNFAGCDLRGARFHSVDASSSNFREANLSNADLTDSVLTNASLIDANLDGLWLSNSTLENAIFEPEPRKLPYLPSLATVKGLSHLRYQNSPSGLTELRSALRDAGMREQERQVNYALIRTRLEFTWAKGGYSEYVFNLLLFDLPCGYGLVPGRPLWILVSGVLIFAVPYLFAILLRKRLRRSGIWAVRIAETVNKPGRSTRSVPISIQPWAAPTLFEGFQSLRRAIKLAFFFSLLSAFSIGFREINVRSWILRLQSREYTLRGTGWVRAIAGFQSLLSVYLIALWVLTYFGRPFE